MYNDELTTIANIGHFEKNEVEIVRVRITKWHGHASLDIRVYTGGEPGEEIATRKGISIPLRHIGNAVHLLVVGLGEARRLGLIDADESQVNKTRATSRQSSETNQLKERARQLHAAGHAPADIARQLGIGRATVYRYLRKPGHQDAQIAHLHGVQGVGDQSTTSDAAAKHG